MLPILNCMHASAEMIFCEYSRHNFGDEISGVQKTEMTERGHDKPVEFDRGTSKLVRSSVVQLVASTRVDTDWASKRQQSVRADVE